RPDFHDEVQRRDYRFGLTQVLTRNLLASIDYEAITEQGYLQNPYRSIRYCQPVCTGSAGDTYAFAPEVFPRTRTSNAVALRLKYYLPWRASLDGRYRYYTDTWGIDAHTAEIEYTHPWGPRWVFSGSYRFSTQNSADFFSDLFPYQNAQNFMARDRAYSALTSNTVGLGAAYEFPVDWTSWLKRGTANLRFDRMRIDYGQFRDLRNYPPGTVQAGTEPLYSYSADILQFFLSFWF
ncbi:MAG TPA: DUF3570 domain-containing protein, partial [Steroidobacteraceae bacterium]|nr:DUF3570 domain-containing protein [Steroidobacteraceae bacterium]